MSRKRKISLKGTLRRFRIWQETGRRAYRRTDAMAEEHKCLNCETVFRGNYCPVCGQSAREKRLSFADIFSNLMGIILNMEKGFLYTVLCLILRPGYMIRDYISGHRIRYTRPIQLLFILATISIAVNFFFGANSSNSLISVIGQENVCGTSTVDSLSKSGIDLELSLSNVDSDTSNGEMIGQWLNNVIGWMSDNLGLTTLLFLPFLMLPMFVSYRWKDEGRKYNYTEFFFVTVYMCDQWYLLYLITYALPNSLDCLLCFFPVVFVWDCRQLFRISWGSSIKRMLLFSALAFVLLLLLTIGAGCLIEFLG